MSTPPTDHFASATPSMPSHAAAPAASKNPSSHKREEKRRRYGTVFHPSLQAAVMGLLRLPNEDAARKRLASIRQYFVTMRPEMLHMFGYLADPATPNPPVALWVKGFGVTAEEEAKGFLGHYALLSIKQLKGGKYTIEAQKLVIPLERHPQKKRPPARHPNWGHPVLRSVKNARVFESYDAAQEHLMQLHEEFPDVTIPNPGKLFVIIFSREATKGTKGGNPTQKIVIKVTEKEEGGGQYVLVWQENSKSQRVTGPLNQAPKETKGNFTAMVQMKRKRTAVPRRPKAAETDTDSDA